MKEITSVSEFVNYLRASNTLYSAECFSKSSPYRFLDYDCPCGRRHDLRKNEDGFLVPSGPLRLKSDPYYSSIRPEIYTATNQVLISCSHVQGLVCVSVERTIFRQSTNTLFFIKYETLNAASNGFGLLYKTSDDIFDFNIIGQSRVKYPTKILTSRIEMEEQILLEPSENILPSPQYFKNMTEYYLCPCGAKHKMEGIREDYSLVQFGKIVTVPILVILTNLTDKKWKSVLYRCPTRYTLLEWRPSVPALWTAEIELFGHDVQKYTRLNDDIFKVFSAHTDRVHIEML